MEGIASPRSWYLTDALGTVRRTVSDAGAIQGTASYSAWGVPQGSLIAPFGFTGELQSGAGLTYLRARWYNASSGRFGSRDPFAGFSEQPYSLHSYQYGYANPVLWTDPSGNSPDRTDIETGRYFYTCNCGWLDVAHLNPQNGGRVIDAVQKAIEALESSENCKEYYIIKASEITQKVTVPNIGKIATTTNNVLIPRGAIKSKTDHLRVAMGIFRWVSVNQESSSLSWGSQISALAAPSTNTYSTEEDLTSNLISFYAKVVGHNQVNNGFMRWLAPICGFSEDEKARKEASLKIFDSYGEFKSVFSWENPRLHTTTCIDDYCSTFKGSRQWPRVFRIIQPEQGGIAPLLYDIRLDSDEKWYVIPAPPQLSGR